MQLLMRQRGIDVPERVHRSCRALDGAYPRAEHEIAARSATSKSHPSVPPQSCGPRVPRGSGNRPALGNPSRITAMLSGLVPASPRSGSGQFLHVERFPVLFGVPEVIL